MIDFEYYHFIMTDSLSELSVQSPSDPDAQATVTDFLDYTEFFPSDLNRSLTLIGDLDESFQQDALRIHDLTRTYGGLNKLPPDSRPDPQSVRRDISLALDHSLRCRQSTYAEASRLSDTADVLYKRLVGIKSKLQALPKPPSREPTPAAPPRSPTLTRGRQNENDKAPRITLMVDGNRPGSRGNLANAPKQRTQSRRIVVPGEVLPPRDPNSPGIPIDSSSDSEDTPPPRPRVGRPPKNPEDRVHKAPKIGKIKLPKFPKMPKMRPHGVMGTNVHSSVAGISVSNALAQLPEPPDNPIPGSMHAPWMKLTEWEMNKLRKRMKKNANWLPSDTMVRRELLDNGRGRENMLRAKRLAEEQGRMFLNEEPPMFSRQALQSEFLLDFDEEYEEAIENRGMRLNEAKKLKRQAARAEAAAQEQIDMEEAARQITNAGMTVQGLLSPNNGNLTGDTLFLSSPSQSAEQQQQNTKKRKRDRRSNTAIRADPSLTESPEVPPSKGVKKLKLTTGLVAGEGSIGSRTTTKVPLDAGNSEPVSPTRASAAAETKGRKSLRVSAASTSAATPVPEATNTTTPSAGGAQSRGKTGLSLIFGNKKAASTEPRPRKDSLRRVSNSSAPSTKQESTLAGKPHIQTAAAQRSKRPAPGVMKSNGEDGGAKISLGKHKANPGRKKSVTGRHPAVEQSDVSQLDDVDPDEPLYCLCNDVSWGEMIGCDNKDCPMEWFHLPCVGLEKIPPRRTQWYCPRCRKALRVGEFGEKLKH